MCVFSQEPSFVLSLSPPVCCQWGVSVASLRGERLGSASLGGSLANMSHAAVKKKEKKICPDRRGKRGYYLVAHGSGGQFLCERVSERGRESERERCWDRQGEWKKKSWQQQPSQWALWTRLTHHFWRRPLFLNFNLTGWPTDWLTLGAAPVKPNFFLNTLLCMTLAKY